MLTKYLFSELIDYFISLSGNTSLPSKDAQLACYGIGNYSGMPSSLGYTKFLLYELLLQLVVL